MGDLWTAFARNRWNVWKTSLQACKKKGEHVWRYFAHCLNLERCKRCVTLVDDRVLFARKKKESRLRYSHERASESFPNKIAERNLATVINFVEFPAGCWAGSGLEELKQIDLSFFRLATWERERKNIGAASWPSSSRRPSCTSPPAISTRSRPSCSGSRLGLF